MSYLISVSSDITSHFQEQEKRMLNGTSSATTTTTTSTTSTGAPIPPPAPPPLPLLSKSRGNDDSVEMQSIESFKLKETPNTVPKPPPTYFPVSSLSAAPNGSPRHIGGSKPPTSNGKDAATSPVVELAKTSPSSASPTNGAQPAKSTVGGKVAIRIGAYEGETKQPSRLEFLSQQTREKNGADDASTNGPVVSRLQNELAATLQRSNLRRKTEGVSVTSRLRDGQMTNEARYESRF